MKLSPLISRPVFICFACKSCRYYILWFFWVCFGGFFFMHQSIETLAPNPRDIAENNKHLPSVKKWHISLLLWAIHCLKPRLAGTLEHWNQNQKQLIINWHHLSWTQLQRSKFVSLWWLNTVFAHALADALQCARIVKIKHSIDTAITLFAQYSHYMYFSS